MLIKKNLPVAICLLCCLLMGWPTYGWSQTPGGGNKAATVVAGGGHDLMGCPNTTYTVPFTVIEDEPCHTKITINGIPGSTFSTLLPSKKGKCACRIKKYTLGYAGSLPPIVSIKLNGTEILNDVTINTIAKTISIPTFGGVSSSILKIEYDCVSDVVPAQFDGYRTLKGGGLCIIVDLGGTDGGSGTVSLGGAALDFVGRDSLNIFGGGTGWGVKFKLPFNSMIGIETEVMGMQSELLLPALAALPSGLEPLIQMDSTHTAVKQFALLLGPTLTLGKGDIEVDLQVKGGLVLTRGPALTIGIGNRGDQATPTNSVFQFAEDRADFAVSLGLQFNYAFSQHWGMYLGGDYFQSMGATPVYQWRDYSQAVQDPDFNPASIDKESWQEGSPPVRSLIFKAGIRYRFSLCR